MHANSANLDYIVKQMNLIEATENRETQISCKWRIASHADLLNDISEDGKLNEAQEKFIDDWMAIFAFLKAGDRCR